MSRVSRLVPALCALALVAGACSDDGDETTDTGAVTEASTTAAATTTAPATTAPATTAAASTTTEAEPTTTEAASLGSIIEVATENGEFSTMLSLIDAAGLTEQLETQQFTLLAPTDEAFLAFGQPAIDALLADQVALTALVENHLLPSPQDADLISGFMNVLTVAGASHVVDGADIASLTIGGAPVVQPDIEADNGIVHGIGAVLVPVAPAG
ncbi:MAG: fasciclin domain-containing protein [Acidimicrobiia bacterium]